MAKELLEAVRNAEAECENIIQQAKNNARLSAQQADELAAERLKLSNDAAHLEAEKKLDGVKKECEVLIANAEQAADEECKKLSAAAENNRSRVINEAVEKFF